MITLPELNFKEFVGLIIAIILVLTIMLIIKFSPLILTYLIHKNKEMIYEIKEMYESHKIRQYDETKRRGNEKKWKKDKKHK